MADPIAPPKLTPIPNAGFRDLDPNGVLEQPFQVRYNSHLEIPVGAFTAILAYTVVAGIAVAMMAIGPSAKDTRPVPITNLGEDDSGDGSRAEGGDPNPLATGEPPTAQDVARVTTQPLNEIKEELQKELKFDVSGEVEIPDHIAAPLKQLDDDIRKKLLGSKQGSGGGARGGDAEGGSGPGGTGNDATRARGLRWVLNFDTRTGRDYLDQLHAMGGKILVPTPDKRRMYIFRDLKTPKFGPIATDADMEELSKQISFSDIRLKSVEAVCEALGVTGYQPDAFWAFFPPEVEEVLARLEKSYRNKRPEDIKQTKFKVVIRGGRFDFIVTDQIMK